MLSTQLAHEPHSWLLQALACSSGASKPTTNGADAKRLAALEKRVKRLEDRRNGGARTALRAARAATDCVATRWVPDDYYGRSMRDRSKLLNCDVRQMCKSMLLENKQWRGTDEFDPSNARFYLVVVQYAATSTPSTRRLLDGVAVPVPHRSTEPGQPRHRREMT